MDEFAPVLFDKAQYERYLVQFIRQQRCRLLTRWLHRLQTAPEEQANANYALAISLSDDDAMPRVLRDVASAVMTLLAYPQKRPLPVLWLSHASLRETTAFLAELAVEAPTALQACEYLRCLPLEVAPRTNDVIQRQRDRTGKCVRPHISLDYLFPL